MMGRSHRRTKDGAPPGERDGTARGPVPAFRQGRLLRHSLLGESRAGHLRDGSLVTLVRMEPHWTDHAVLPGLLERAAALARDRSVPGTVRVRGVAPLDTGGLCVVTEYVPSPTLRRLTERAGLLPPPLALWLAHRVARSLHLLDLESREHGALDPTSILCTSEGPVLADHSLAGPLRRAAANLNHFQPLPRHPEFGLRHLAPELAGRTGWRGGTAADVFALGMVLRHSTNLKAPYEGAEAVHDLVERCLRTQTRRRPSAQRVARMAANALEAARFSEEWLRAEWQHRVLLTPSPETVTPAPADGPATRALESEEFEEPGEAREFEEPGASGESGEYGENGEYREAATAETVHTVETVEVAETVQSAGTVEIARTVQVPATPAAPATPAVPATAEMPSQGPNSGELAYRKTQFDTSGPLSDEPGDHPTHELADPEPGLDPGPKPDPAHQPQPHLEPNPPPVPHPARQRPYLAGGMPAGVDPRAALAARNSVPSHRTSRSTSTMPLHTTAPATTPAPGWTTDLGFLPDAPLAHESGVLYAAGTDRDTGALCAVDVRDGSVLWRFRTAGPCRARPVPYEGGVLLASRDGMLHSVNRLTGQADWAVPIDDPLGSAPAVLGDHVWLGGITGLLQAVDLRDGRLGRVRPPGNPADVAASSPLAGSDCLWVTTAGGLHRLAGDGSVIWSRYELGDLGGLELALEDGLLFGTTPDGRVHAHDAASGEPVWVRATDQRTVGPPLAAHGVVHVGTAVGTAGVLHTFDAVSGSPLRTLGLPSPVTGPPAYGQGALLAATRDRRLRAVAAEDGRSLWSWRAGGRFGRSGLLVAAGRVFTGASDCHLHAVAVRDGSGGPPGLLGMDPDLDATLAIHFNGPG
ncbi:PQQ-binding-like beta-propeller repeat protein [Streptomyces sp. J2-1]|uniref:outer membrane protein assembly factor BamB family protein n=1 Tax=Streptomyces corallincola TaxID=2851888 RepID=UPI001C386198|nr:PQQ-binding-like beta-propeller repeat protein [Streptomyces corallincola]MBV2355552.1 PQQ-binding-like beta-propeller repeat protein [Streptomyces corallincola]